MRTFVKAKVSKNISDLAADIKSSFAFTAKFPATTERKILFFGQLSEDDKKLANLYARTAEEMIDRIAAN